MKKEADRILKRSVLSILVAAALYTPQAMAGFTEVVTEGSTVIGETVENGRQTVESGGTAENTTINKGGWQTVYGTATDTTIYAGGTLQVWAGGNATGVKQKEGAALIATTTTSTVVKGQNKNGEFSIENGQADNVLLENGGLLTVVYGTTANNTTIRDGGTLEVRAGGKATGVDQRDGAALFTTTATGTVVKGQNKNGEFFIENGQADNVLLENGGALTVWYGTTANKTTINKGGEQYVYGTATGTTIYDGGTLEVRAGGNATGVDQKKGAALIATTATGTVVKGQNKNGEFSIENGQADNVLLENGGALTVVDGTTADRTTIRDGGELIVNKGGTTLNTGIESGGLQTVESGGTATDTTIYDGGTLEVWSGGNATGVKQKEGAALIATTATDTVVKGQYENGAAFFIENGQADNVLLENGGRLTVVDGTTATGTTVSKSGMQTVYAGGKAEDTIINEGGLMLNAGEDSGTTVKDGGVYELGRYNAGSTDYPYYRYYGTAGASDLTVEAGGRATVYAGTLTGATVSGANASLTLMTPQTETYDSDLTLSLKGQVSVTEGGRLVAQRGADMSEADLSLSSQGTLILKGDADCPENGCSWSV
ncbi:TPA: AIDA repeat-containing protein, partial [Escherichia coli]